MLRTTCLLHVIPAYPERWERSTVQKDVLKKHTKKQHLIMQISEGVSKGCEEREEQMVDRKPAFISFSVSPCLCLAAAAL